jgi:hypothetical protein
MSNSVPQQNTYDLASRFCAGAHGRSASLHLPSTSFRMTYPREQRTMLRSARVAALLLAGLIPGAAAAAGTPTPASPAATQVTATQVTATPPPSGPTTQDVTLNLIHLLVQQNIITAAQADALFSQAKKEAASATPAVPGAPPTKTIRVTYVPEVIREQIKEQTKKEVLEETHGALAPPTILPEWMRRITVSGDFRMRYERMFNDGTNFPNFGDYNAVNQSSNGADISPFTSPGVPLINSTQNRSRVRVRARIEFDDRVNNAVTVGLRLSTGDNTSPVSPNQTQGNYSGNGGNFSPYAVTIDRAFLRYTPNTNTKLLLGRFASPWLSTDLVWYRDLNFDGVALQYNREVTSTVRPFVTAGVFPIENTALSFPSLSQSKEPSRDKWLYAAQVGVSWLPSSDYLLKFGLAFYDFAKIQGELSSPCSTNLSGFPCSTDDTRAGFLQHGNTVFAIRNPITAPTEQSQVAEYQLYGLASPFRVADFTSRIDFARYAPIHITFNGDFAYNTAYNEGRIIALNPDNNVETGVFRSGPLAFQTGLTVGNPEMYEFGDWNMSVIYKYIEADSVVDAFNDADFHGGGTNAKGYVLRGNMGLAHNVWLTGNFFSATEVSGPPFAEDTLQMDVNARF